MDPWATGRGATGRDPEGPGAESETRRAVKDVSTRGRVSARCAGSEEATSGPVELAVCSLAPARGTDDGPAWGTLGIGMPSNLGSGIGVKSRSRRRLVERTL